MNVVGGNGHRGLGPRNTAAFTTPFATCHRRRSRASDSLRATRAANGNPYATVRHTAASTSHPSTKPCSLFKLLEPRTSKKVLQKKGVDASLDVERLKLSPTAPRCSSMPEFVRPKKKSLSAKPVPHPRSECDYSLMEFSIQSDKSEVESEIAARLDEDPENLETDAFDESSYCIATEVKTPVRSGCENVPSEASARSVFNPSELDSPAQSILGNSVTDDAVLFACSKVKVMGPNKQSRGKKASSSSTRKSKSDRSRRQERAAKKKKNRDSDEKDKSARRRKSKEERSEKLKSKLIQAQKSRGKLPKLFLSKFEVTELNGILDQYQKAKEVFGYNSQPQNELEGLDYENLTPAQIERLLQLNDELEEESDDSASSDSSSESDSEDSDSADDFGSDDVESLDDDVVQDYLENMDRSGSASESHVEVDSAPTQISLEGLSWLKAIGFSQSRSISALKDILEAIRYLYNTALPRNYQLSASSYDKLDVFGVSVGDMLSAREDEEAILSEVLGEDFCANSDSWHIYLDAAISEKYLAKHSKTVKHPSRQHILEIYFPGENSYPFEPPLIIFRDESGRLPARLAFVFSLISWLANDGGDMNALLTSPPLEFIKLAEDDGSYNSFEVETSRKVNSSPSTGPVPTYNQVTHHVGVAITLKQDQGTGRTVTGFVDKGTNYFLLGLLTTLAVLTRGNHPRGIKVRLTDGRVGRVQFLTAEKWASRKEGALQSQLEKLVLDDKGSPSATSSKQASKHRNPVKPFPTQVVVRLPPVEMKYPTRKLEEAELIKESNALKEAFDHKSETEEYRKMLSQRESLPAFKQKDTILHTLQNNQVVIISGETGCGKSTQVPQLILDQAISENRGAWCKILIAQPRRISAIGLADRVAAERAEQCGKTVGYHIRLESRMSPKTRLLFCTTGIMLRRLEEGPHGETVEGGIDDVSHVIVDEVHERSVDSDLLLKMLKDLIRVRQNLKVILMSATLNAELFAEYFDNAPVVHIPGRTFAVNALFLEDVLAKVKYTPPSDLCRRHRPGSMSKNQSSQSGDQTDLQKKKAEEKKQQNQRTLNDAVDEDLDYEALLKRYPKLTESGAKALAVVDTNKIQYPLIEILVSEIVENLLGGKRLAIPGMSSPEKSQKKKNKSKPQKSAITSENVSPSSSEASNRGILIFLPGMAEIVTLHELLQSNASIRAATQNGKLCMALHGVLSSEEQKRVFNKPPENAVKIIIATNVAETSITIDDIVFVIDSGKMKQTQYDPTKGMASLDEWFVFIGFLSSSLIQDVNVVGYPEQMRHNGEEEQFSTFHEQQPPEIQRISLEQMCLRVKITPFLKGSIAQILSEMIEPPSDSSIKSAISSLEMMGALTEEEDLTSLGFHLARLPVDAKIGKFILYGSIFGCLDSALTIAAAMSGKSPFVAPFDKRGLADAKKKGFSTGFSDHLTLLVAYDAWISARQSGHSQENAFLFDNFLSRTTLNTIASLKRQFAEELSDTGFIKVKLRARDLERQGGRFSDGVAEAIGESRRPDDHELVKAILVAALYPNVIKIDNAQQNARGGAMRFCVEGDEFVAIHPASVNVKIDRFPSSFLVYHEKVKTTKVYIRDCSSVSPLALAFFGGPLHWHKLEGVVKIGDGWIRFAADYQTANTIVATRFAFDELLQMKIDNPELDVSSTRLVRQIVQMALPAFGGWFKFRDVHSFRSETNGVSNSAKVATPSHPKLWLMVGVPRGCYRHGGNRREQLALGGKEWRLDVVMNKMRGAVALGCAATRLAHAVTVEVQPPANTARNVGPNGLLYSLNGGPLTTGCWMMSLSVGTTKFHNVMIDSGSSDLVLPGVKLNQYGPQEATYAYNSSYQCGANVESGYGDGSSWTGGFFLDTVSFGGISTKAYVAIMKQQNPSRPVCNGDSSQGIFGVAYDNLARSPCSPYTVFTALYLSQAIPQNIFALRGCPATSSSVSYADFGGTDSSLSCASDSNPIGWAKVTSNTYYVVNVQGVRVGSKQLPLDPNWQTDYNGGSIVDSCTTLLTLPSSIFNSFVTEIKQSKALQSAGISNDMMTALLFNFNGLYSVSIIAETAFD
ncbi:ATPdependent RNA helicase [Entophlyctis luteolus]|nr:ATPdependent RNA helicase [Entophlyctis luteolus]